MNEEQQWIDDARKGDQEAFEQLVRRYEKRVFALTSRMCRNPADAEEAAQEAFLSTWLYRLASNACVDLLRREGRHQAVAGPSLDDGENPYDPEDPAPSPHALAERAELRREIEAGLAALPPEYRQVLVLRELHQCTYDEIAAICSLDLGTVKSRISRGRKQLRKILLASGNFSEAAASNQTGKEGCQ